MKPDDIIIGQFYVIDEIDNEPPNLTAFLRGTNRVVRIVSRDTHNPHRFYAEHYGYPIYSEWIKRWVPGVGELAEFSDNKIDWYQCIFAGYSHGTMKYPMRVDGGEIGNGYRYARPVQKKAEPVPDRNQTFELAELEAMQEERIAIDDDWRGHINVMMQELIARLEALEAKDNDPRYAALKKRLTKLEDWQDRVGAWRTVSAMVVIEEPQPALAVTLTSDELAIVDEALYLWQKQDVERARVQRMVRWMRTGIATTNINHLEKCVAAKQHEERAKRIEELQNKLKVLKTRKECL